MRQVSATRLHQPGELLHSMTSPWPFMKWGMDIIGPLPLGAGKVTVLLILTDYFSKWVEAGAYPKIGEHEVIDFIWDHIVCRFGIPKALACDNGPKFVGSKVTKFLENLKIKIITSSPYHPSANG
nr:protein NYNRIN-like [Nicotiana tomentosiformis]